ncbi:MAG: Fic family protein [Bullifex sp.]
MNRNIEPYNAKTLVDINTKIDLEEVYSSLINASTSMGILQEKIQSSKTSPNLLLSILRMKEAIASSNMEETETNISSVMVDQVTEKHSHDTAVVQNYLEATTIGVSILTGEKFGDNFFKRVHAVLMKNNKKTDVTVGEYRTRQNFIKNRLDASISYVSPVPEQVQPLMRDLISFMNTGSCYHELISSAIIHGQFLTIHPFDDGNGRMSRILVPLYLFQKKVIKSPFLFFSEALEKDKSLYYRKLNLMREGDWNGWIVFFLDCIDRQCRHYIDLINDVSDLYEKESLKIKELIKSKSYVDIVDMLFNRMVVNKGSFQEIGITSASATRYLKILNEAKIISTDTGKTRNRIFFYDALMHLLTK